MAVEVIVVDAATCLTVLEKNRNIESSWKNKKCKDYSFSAVTQHAGS